MLRTFRSWVSLVVSASIFVATPAPLFAGSSRSQEGYRPDYNFTNLQEYDPLFKEFAEVAWAPPKMGPYDANDPILDQDPYFMRSQGYAAPFRHTGGEGTAYQTAPGRVQILLPGAPARLRSANLSLRSSNSITIFSFKARTNSSFWPVFRAGTITARGCFFSINVI
ncbi:MAG: hypothetical protein HC902_08955 [Calothrix sp. SM1_5_4]|nr:hypothetical protein [Calothrix sp. SM1_5_4]